VLCTYETPRAAKGSASVNVKSERRFVGESLNISGAASGCVEAPLGCMIEPVDVAGLG
jgi:hypothetical protein